MGAAMGFTPQHVDQMSVWQFFAALDGWLEANTSGEGLSESEKDDLWDWMQDRPPVPVSKWVH